ncbi:hypothetical protein KZZ52_27070 [Dactylosporangium sp. AC04546]|uniref:hypothetical protein n=1 Tax=Dactylosporangium sp. AC04546 TaxID=2862460 RepID=UPI001EDE8E37|nr:hypothetical protein [Dactylosporangium sp. AC04546]WVK88928.1 hypothetical protein KZZ52_27070 [Dactylosporangium sp. AC04546]
MSSSEATLLPADIAQRMTMYGRYEFAPQQSPPDTASRVNDLIYQPLYPVAAANPDAFVAALADAVLPVGGWAVYGGQRCVRDLITVRIRHPGYVAMVVAALRFLRQQNYGLMNIAPAELEVWREIFPSSPCDGEW